MLFTLNVFFNLLVYLTKNNIKYTSQNPLKWQSNSIIFNYLCIMLKLFKLIKLFETLFCLVFHNY